MDFRDIIKVFQDHNVTISRDDTWAVQSAKVIKHKALERLAAALDIRYREPKILRAEADEAVILATGYLQSGREEWSIGEAKVGLNYKVSGKQAGYPYAMAEKRAKDRVIIKLAGLHGAYSEDEADEFKDDDQKRFAGEEDISGEKKAEPKRRGRPPKARETVSDGDSQDGNLQGDPPAEDQPQGERSSDASPDEGKPQDDQRPQEPANDDDDVDVRLKKKLDDLTSPDAIADFMLQSNVQRALKAMSEARRNEVRDYAKARMAAEGFPGGKKAS